MDNAMILEAFGALAVELARRDAIGEVFVVGGAAMALAYSRRRVTRDVDAVFEPKLVVYEAARLVAEDLGLPDDWLNDAVKSFAPGSDDERRTVFTAPTLSVSVASPRYLLAMKLLASRVDQDLEDIQTLYRICGYTTAGEGIAVLESFYPGVSHHPRTRFLLEELFGPIDLVQ